MGESEEELKSPLMKVKQESEKVGLKLNIWQKNKDHGIQSYLFSSVQSLSHVQLFTTPWSAACQASLSMANSQSLLKLTSIESLMPSNNLILCHPLLLLPSIFPSIRVFSNESVLHIRRPKYWSFSFSISPSNEYSRTDFLQDGLVGSPCSPITSWQIDWKTMETVRDFILGGSKVTADGDCSHEIKRLLIPGRKAITNLDSIL